MKIAIRTIQWIVGILFILSGLVKANDPMGLSFKMQEFFEIWNADLSMGKFFARNLLISLFEWLHNHAVTLSVTMITLEIVAGVALILGWKRKLVLWTLLVLIVFFTFLTAYAFLSTNADGSPKFTNCGCFGDCLPLEPRTSFIKDIALLAMILFLLAGYRHVHSVFSAGLRNILLAFSLVVSLLIQWYVLNYLPFKDCLPFKEGNSLPEKIKVPVGAKPSKYESRLVYRNINSGQKKEMSQEEFNNSKIWEDPSWKWDTTLTKLVEKGNDIPEIQGFSLLGREKMDSTEIVLSHPAAILAFGLDEPAKRWISDFKILISTARQKNIPVYFTTNNPAYYIDLFHKENIEIPVFSTDFTVIRTAARTNPAFYYLEKGKIINKYSYRQIDDLNKYIQSVQ